MACFVGGVGPLSFGVGVSLVSLWCLFVLGVAFLCLSWYTSFVFGVVVLFVGLWGRPRSRLCGCFVSALSLFSFSSFGLCGCPLCPLFSSLVLPFSSRVLPASPVSLVRSAACVSALAASPAPLLVLVPVGLCPPFVSPFSSVFPASPSPGCWSFGALALSLGVPVFFPAFAGVFPPPASWGAASAFVGWLPSLCGGVPGLSGVLLSPRS